jgi:hypothetical protein
MSATGPDGRGCVLPVAGAVVVLAPDPLLLLLEHDASAIAAHARATVTENGVERVRTEPSRFRDR